MSMNDQTKLLLKSHEVRLGYAVHGRRLHIALLEFEEYSYCGFKLHKTYLFPRKELTKEFIPENNRCHRCYSWMKYCVDDLREELR